MSKKTKQLEIDALTKTFEGVRDLILIAPGKVDSATDYQMRKTLRDKKIRVKMVKNTLARKVLAKNGVDAGEHWAGPTLLAWGSDSIKDLSKAVDELVKDVAKKNPKAVDLLKVKTAVADGVAVPLSTAMTMPTRLEAIGEIVMAIAGQGGAILSALMAPAGQLASQIQVISERTPEGDAPAADAAPAEAAPATA